MNKKLFLSIIKCLIIFLIGGHLYYGIEILWRGYSHFSMFVLGGLCFLIIGSINEKFFQWSMYIEVQILIGELFVVLSEFNTGCIVNILLGLNVWDYSDMPLNIMGQICVPFILLWIPLVGIAIILDDYIRYLFFNEEKPKYKSFIINKIKNR